MFTNEKPATREEKIKFLTDHRRYYTMNSWNRASSYANNVKIYVLDVDETTRNQMYELLSAEHSDLDDEIRCAMDDFAEETGYSVGFNGRSDGYIVLYDTEYDADTGKRRTMPGRSIDQYEDFEEWEDSDIDMRVNLVRRFDQLCDEIVNITAEYCKTHHRVEKTVSVPRTFSVFVPNDSTNEDEEDEEMEKLLPDGYVDNVNAENDEDKVLGT